MSHVRPEQSQGARATTSRNPIGSIVATETQQLITALETINTTLKTMQKDIVGSLDLLLETLLSVKDEVREVKKQVSIMSSDITERLEPIAYSAVEVTKSMPCQLRSFACKLVLMSVTEAVEDVMGRGNTRCKSFDSCIYLA